MFSREKSLLNNTIMIKICAIYFFEQILTCI